MADERGPGMTAANHRCKIFLLSNLKLVPC